MCIRDRMKKTTKKGTSDQGHYRMVVNPYIEQLYEATERIFHKCGIITATKTYKTLRNLPVSPEDKYTATQTGEYV